MKKVVVASKNPVKINATLRGFQKMFPHEQFEVDGISVPSGVSDQPCNDAETLAGAVNRANGAYAQGLDADFYVDIEGGIEARNGEMEAFAWIVIKKSDGRVGKGRSGTFFLPPQIVDLIHQGKELGEADDIVFGKQNSKQKDGTVGALTDNIIDRTVYYTEPVVLALIPFKNEALYAAAHSRE